MNSRPTIAQLQKQLDEAKAGRDTQRHSQAFNPLDFAIYLGADFRQMYLDR